MTGAHVYSAFGRTIHADEPLPGLPPGRGADKPLHVAFSDALPPPPRDPPGSFRGFERVWVREDATVLHYETPGGEVVWTMRAVGDGERLEVACTHGVGPDEVTPVVETIGLAAAVARRAVPLLHACAVDAGGRALAVAGMPGAGKSTVAAGFVARGHALLCDDVAALDPGGGRPRLHPAGCLLRIHPDTASALGWDPEALDTVFAARFGDSKRGVRLSAADGSFCPETLPVGALVVLAPRVPGGARATVRLLSRADALRVLMQQTFAARLVDAAGHARRFAQWAQIAGTVPVYEVAAPDDLRALPRLLERLLGLAEAPVPHGAW